jgi:hypothetical protein
MKAQHWIAVGCVLVLAALFAVRVLIRTAQWASCTGSTTSGFALSFQHLGASPSAGDCLLYALGNAGKSPATTISTAPPVEAPTSSLPGPTSTNADYGTKSCAEGGCTVWGPCPEGPDHPPVSHWICTTTTESPADQAYDEKLNRAQQACNRERGYRSGDHPNDPAWVRCMNRHGIVGG